MEWVRNETCWQQLLKNPAWAFRSLVWTGGLVLKPYRTRFEAWACTLVERVSSVSLALRSSEVEVRAAAVVHRYTHTELLCRYNRSSSLILVPKIPVLVFTHSPSLMHTHSSISSFIFKFTHLLTHSTLLIHDTHLLIHSTLLIHSALLIHELDTILYLPELLGRSTVCGQNQYSDKLLEVKSKHTPKPCSTNRRDGDSNALPWWWMC